MKNIQLINGVVKREKQKFKERIDVQTNLTRKINIINCDIDTIWYR